MKYFFTHLLHMLVLCISASLCAKAQHLSTPDGRIAKLSTSLLYDNWPVTVTTNDRRKAKSIVGKTAGNNQSNFATIGGQWNHRNITYFINGGTPDIPGNGEQQAISEAFAIWASQTNLSFTEVFNPAQADIELRWAFGDHGDGAPFDGPGNGNVNVLAHATGPAGILNGDVHFDEFETWTDAPQAFGFQPIDLVTVAAHEIGHSLGLDHTNIAGSLMLPAYVGSQRCLGADDIAGIQSIYGVRNYTVVGTGGFCTGSSTYSVGNLAPNTTVTWSSSDPSIATIDPATGVATATGSGTVVFTVTFNNSACANSAISLDKQVKINVGPEYPQLDIIDIDPCNRLITYQIVNYNPSSTYAVTKSSTISYLPGSPESGIIRFKGGSRSKGGSFSIKVTSSCASGSYTINDSFSFDDCNPSKSDDNTTTAYPNPVAEVLTLPVGASQVTLLDKQGHALLQANELGKLDVRALPDGLYNLQMMQDGKLINQRIQVKH